MRKLLVLFLIFALANKISAIELTADLFTYDEAKIEAEFAELNKLESYIHSNPEASFDEVLLKYPELSGSLFAPNSTYDYLDLAAPGKISSFWFCFTFSAIGTYFIYGVVAGPISVGIVYFSSHKDKSEVKKAFWGCLAGTLIGAGIKYAVLNL